MSSSYKWEVKDKSTIGKIQSAKDGDNFKSDLFSMCNFRWQLELCPNRSTAEYKNMTMLYLYLKVLPPKLKSITFNAKYAIYAKTGNIKMDTDHSLTHKLKCAAAWSSGKAKEVRKYIKSMKKNEGFTVQVHIDLLSVFDQNDNDITSQYLSTGTIQPSKLDLIMSKLQELEQRIRHLELRQNDEHKNDDYNAEEHALRKWIEKTVGLPMYYAAFRQHGVNSLSSTKLLKMSDFSNMGIKKDAHQVILFHEINKLKRKNNGNHHDAPPVEGGVTTVK